MLLESCEPKTLISKLEVVLCQHVFWSEEWIDSPSVEAVNLSGNLLDIYIYMWGNPVLLLGSPFDVFVPLVYL